jgi:hypothetical protein
MKNLFVMTKTSLNPQYFSAIDASVFIPPLPHGLWVKEKDENLVIGASIRSLISGIILVGMVIFAATRVGPLVPRMAGNPWYLNLLFWMVTLIMLMGGFLFFAYGLMNLFGKVEVSLDRDGGRVFTGIGKMGLNQEFLWEDIQQAVEGMSSIGHGNFGGKTIQFEGKRRVSAHWNISRDRRESLLHILQEIVHQKSKLPQDVSYSDFFDLDYPPKGAWARRERDQLIIGASTQSLFAIYLIPLMLTFSGGALGAIYGTQFVNGFDMTISLIGIPFVLLSIFFWIPTLMATAGKIEITLNEKGGKIFRGIGMLGLNQRFQWDKIDEVFEKPYNANKAMKIQLKGAQRRSFGTMLKPGRRFFLLRALQEQLAQAKQ